MIVRKIKPEERITATKIQAIAFTFSRDFKAEENDEEKLSEDSKTCRAVFDDNGKMCSCFELLPFELSFDDKIVKMAGIGGVASLPEERKKGYIRELFKYSFKEMRENGQWFSYLYPFSNIYYRQYGFEACLRQYKAKIPLASFKGFPDTGHVRMYNPGEDSSEIKDIYLRFVRGKNLAIIRSDEWWDKYLQQDPYKNITFTYVWYNVQGEPKSYICFKAKNKEDYKADMIVQELVWLDGEALLGIFGFLKGFSPRYQQFIWENPGFLNLSLLFKEPYDVKFEACSSGMNRIVDLAEVLKLKSVPSGEGSLTFKVSDNFLEWNNGTFVVSWGKAGVNVERRECSPDLTCSIQVMTQLVTGYTDLEDYLYDKDVVINEENGLLYDYFRKKKLFINDHF